MIFVSFNVSLKSDGSFTDSLNSSLEKARFWILSNHKTILENPNIALLRMLDESSRMNKDSSISEIVNTLMRAPSKPDCWKALIDPNRPVNQKELYETAGIEVIDNQWTLFAIGKGNINITPEELGIFDGNRWKERQLNHQLWALVHLRERTKPDDKLKSLIEHLTDRIEKGLASDKAIVDIYIQKIAFVLRAGFPEKIRRRWIERIISNQSDDGGWNDKWLCFNSGRKPVFGDSPTNQHATIQAYWLLCQVKYKYPEYFGVPKENKADRNQFGFK
jgi:hypothetical protein